MSAADISAELEAVISSDFAEVIRPLVYVTYLRQFTFKVVADDRAAGNGNKRQARVARQSCRDSGSRCGRVRETMRCINGGTRGMHGPVLADVRGLVVLSLGLTEVGKPGLIYSCRSDRPGMACIQLLKTRCKLSPEPRNIGAGALKKRKLVGF